MSDNSARSLKRPNSLPKIDEPTKRQKVNEQTSPQGFTQSDIERNVVSIDGNTVGQEIHGANLDVDIEDNVDDEEDVSDETIDNEDDNEDDEDTEHGNGVYHEEQPWVEDMLDLEREENENLNNSDTTTGDDEATNHNEDRSEPEDNDLYARSSSSKNPFAGD